MTVRLPRTWIAPPIVRALLLATLWQFAKCISAEDSMKASSAKNKHGPNKNPEPFTESLPSKRAVFEKFSDALRSSVAPRWSVENDPWQWEKTAKIRRPPRCKGSAPKKWGWDGSGRHHLSLRR